MTTWSWNVPRAIGGMVAAVSLLLAMPQASAQKGKGSDEKLNVLATKEVNAADPSVTYDMPESKGSVRGVRLYNRRGDTLSIAGVRVEYNDKTVYEEKRNFKLDRGDRSKEMNRGAAGEKFVDRVIVTLAPGGRGAATIEVLGAQTSQDVVAVRRPTGNIAAGTVAPAQAVGDHILGSQTIEPWRTDRDVMKIGQKYGKFDSIRLKVLEVDIDLLELKAVYANGESEVLAYNATLAQGTKSRELKLKGDRFINELHLTYKTKPNFRKRATVQVWGQYAVGGFQPGDPEGWIHLGSDTANWGIDSRDTVPVGQYAGAFKQLRLEPSMDITLFRLTVVYANGEQEQIAVPNNNRLLVKGGGFFGPIDIKGGQPIKEIRPSYRTRLIQPGGLRRAVVEFWGRQ